MKLGNFSNSLAVKNLETSKMFYMKLGFEPCGGDESQGWLILRNDSCVIGLFQGMFEKNILTFNPGWDIDCETLDDYTDVRELQKELKSLEIAFDSEADENGTGPDSFIITDPDGNPIMVDQHV